MGRGAGGRVEAELGEPAGFVHRGLTSSDVLDMSLAMLLREAWTLIDGELARCLDAVRRRAFEHRRTPCIGRSHGIHAEPTTFGLKLAVWHGHLDRARSLLRAAAQRVALGKLAPYLAHVDAIFRRVFDRA